MEFRSTPKRRNAANIFQVNQIKSRGFTCENHANEFPKIIRYHKELDKLMAEIEGGDMKIPYVFEKIGK